MSLVLYDIPSKTETSISPACWKVRYMLNYKKIPFRTVWIEYPDIAALYMTNGIAHTVCNPDGTPKYTLPVLHDPDTGLYISDSLNIADYIEKTYARRYDGNNIPSVFPACTEGLHVAVSNLFMTIVVMPNFPIIAATISEGLNLRSLEFYRIPREKIINKALEEVAPSVQIEGTLWADFKQAMAKFDAYYQKNGLVDGPFIMRKDLSWTDLSIAAFLTTFKVVWGEESKKWEDLKGWHNGRWGKLIQALKEYE